MVRSAKWLGRGLPERLSELAEKCGHPELAKAPWALWGHSGGGHWAGGMALLHPDRIAAAWLRSGIPQLKPNPDRPTLKPYKISEAVLAVPMMCNLGTKEGFSVKEGNFAGVWPGNLAFFTELRANGALIGVAVDPLTSHECGNQRYLAIPWLDACLTARLPSEPGAPLRAMSESTVMLAPLLEELRLRPRSRPRISPARKSSPSGYQTSRSRRRGCNMSPTPTC